MTDTDVANPKETIINTTLDNQGSIQDTYYKKENGSPVEDHITEQFMSKINFSMMKKQNSGLDQTPLKSETHNSKMSSNSKK